MSGRFVWLSVLLIAVHAVCAGCGSLQRPFPAKGRYALGVSAPGPKDQVNQAPGSSVAGRRVEEFRFREPYDGINFVYRTGELAYSTDYYNEFVAPPGKMLTDAAVAMLRQKHVFPSVVGPWATNDTR